MNAKRVNAAAGVIHGSQVAGKQTATGLAADLEAACMLQSPETAAELAGYRALELGDVDGRVSASCGKPHHPTWLRAANDTRGCPWCEIDGAHEETIGANLARWEEEQENARMRLALASAQRGRREAREVARNAVRVAEESVAELKREHEANAALRARVAELDAQREALSARLRAGQRWKQGRTPALVSQDFVSQDELRAMFGIPMVAPWDEPTKPDALTRTFAPTASLREDPHDSPLHHGYRLGRDLPQPDAAP